jgi:serine/threonine protein kinase/WD40 repeat protein
VADSLLHTKNLLRERSSILGLLPGDVIDGRFRIGALIGYGGQGVVLEVEHLGWACKLALKLPLPQAVNSPQKQARFIREAETWIRLGVHPHIVRCWFVREVSGLPGLFLDLITGGSLEDQIKVGTVGPGRWKKNVDVLLQMAEGLAHSHKMGVVHRDIKPENLLVTRGGQICVTDFGLVKSSARTTLESQEIGAEALTADPGVTSDSEFLGTPRYGAPEQWNKALKITPATDIYALGVIFYELLCGRRPFDGPDEKRLDPLVLIHRHLKEPPPDPRDFRRKIPAPLVKLCLRCLSKNATDRPQNASEMVTLLAEVHQKVKGVDYQRPAEIPGGDRADLLNNAAVSLYSLGMAEKCREYLEKGLLLQADHPHCLYNLVQLDRREGKIGSAESLQRLQRSNAEYPLALLCIEEGHPHLATAILRKVPLYHKNGLVFRTEGDALMYQGKFDLAVGHYREARVHLPHDSETLTRLSMAEQKQRSLNGEIYFPSPVSRFSSPTDGEDAGLVLSDDGKHLICATAEGVSSFDITGSEKVVVRERPATATAAVSVRLSGRRLLVEDHSGFELWDFNGLTLMKRSAGKILAVATFLSHVVYIEGDTLYAADPLKDARSAIHFPPDSGDPRKARVCFSSDTLFLLSENGRVGHIDSRFHVLPLDWPSHVPEAASADHFQVHQSGLMVVSTSDCLLAVYDLKVKTELFRQELPFVPTQIFVESTGLAIVVSSPEAFRILSREGRVLHEGVGACDVDPSFGFALAWLAGSLSLYTLHPFRKVRAWGENVRPPSTIKFDCNGRRAVTSSAGECRVWDVDEDHRVFERELLLTPGASYHELLESYQSYKRAYDEALAYQKKREYFMAYTSIKMARSAPGFLQNEDALKSQWKLAGSLRRGGVDAFWERLHLNDVTAMTLSGDGKAIGLVRGDQCLVYRFDGSSTSLRFTVEGQTPILGCHFLRLKSGSENFYTIEESGRIRVYNAKVGIPITDLETGLRPVVKIRFCENSLFLMTSLGMGATFDLKKLVVKGQAELGTEDPDSVFPYLNETALSLLDSGAYLVDLVKGTSKLGFPLALESFDSPVSCLTTGAGGGLVMSGFEDGSVVMGQLTTGKPLFQASYPTGRVTGLKVDLAAAIGVSISAGGCLSIFDLNDKETLKSLTFSNPIVDLNITEDGRFLATRTENQEFWLWEIAWALTPKPGPISVDWIPKSRLRRFVKFFGKRG